MCSAPTPRTFGTEQSEAGFKRRAQHCRHQNIGGIHLSTTASAAGEWELEMPAVLEVE